MSEEKIGMYSTEEIYEELANGFLHHSMVDAMYFKIKDLQQKVEQQEKERDRLNNIINRIDSFVDRTIEVIKQQPTGDDEWILERLNGIKYLIELKENK